MNVIDGQAGLVIYASLIFYSLTVDNILNIIVLLILAGISISMLSGDNSILQKATDAKTETEKSQIIENAQTDILGQQTDNKAANITKEQLVAILNKYFKNTESTSIPDEVSSEQGHDYELTTIDDKYTIMLSEVFKGKFSTQNNVVTFGEKYEDSMIGKTIDYKSEKNNVNDWIILGMQENAQGKKDVLITTKNPVSSLEIEMSIAGWIGYEESIKSACKTYVGETGMLGIKDATIKEIRSIKLNDINNAVGFNENINSITISNSNGGFAYPNSNGSEWIKKTDESYSSYPYPTEAYYYYKDNGYKFWSNSNASEKVITLGNSDNMVYIFANNTPYWVCSRSIGITSECASFHADWVGMGGIGCRFSTLYLSDENGGRAAAPGSHSMSLRPVVVLSSEIPWEDVKNLIGNYASYN